MIPGRIKYIREQARLGQFHLEAAMLEVLLEARESGDGWVRAMAIARCADIYYRSPGPACRNAITAGILSKLYEEGRIEQSRSGGPWRLTENEFKRLADLA